MKAIFFRKTGSIAELEYGDLPDEGQNALVDQHCEIEFVAGALNHLDLWVLKGLPRVRYRFPHIAGADLCARVVKTKSKSFSIGDEVLLYPAYSQESIQRDVPENQSEDFAIRGENISGVFRERMIVDARWLRQKPKHLKAETAAALPLVSITAWQMLTQKAELFPGRFDPDAIGSVLVHGAGSGVTQALLDFLISFGVKRIAVTSRDPKKLEQWKAKGLEGFSSGESNFEDSLKKYAGREKFKIIFDHVGESFFELNLRLLAHNGKWITCGATSGHQASIDLRALYFKQFQLIGSTMGSLRHFHECLGWIEARQLSSAAKHFYKGSQCQEAYRLMEQGKQDGKIVLTSLS